MPHTYANNFVHCVFSTKERRPLIPTARTAELYAYLGSIARGEGFSLIAAGGNGESHSFAFRLAGVVHPCPCASEAERQLFPVDGRWVFVAGGIWGVQC